MGNVVKYTTKEDLNREKLKNEVCEMIDQGLVVIVISHNAERNTTELLTNRNLTEDRIGVKGVIADALDIMTCKFIIDGSVEGETLGDDD